MSLIGIFSQANRPFNDVISIAFGSIDRWGINPAVVAVWNITDKDVEGVRVVVLFDVDDVW